MCQVAVAIPDEVLYDKDMSIADAQAFARRMTALGLYADSNVSIGYCAQVAGMCESDFLRFLGTYGVGVFDAYELSELEEDVRNA